MDAVLHVIASDHVPLPQGLEALRIDGELSDGPAPDAEPRAINSWLLQRQSYFLALANTATAPVSIRQHSEQTSEQCQLLGPAGRAVERLLKDVPDRAVVFWCGESLQEQLSLCWLVHFLVRAHGSRVRMSVVHSFAPSTSPAATGGIGGHGGSTTTNLTPNLRSAACSLWTAFSVGSPADFETCAFVHERHPLFGYLPTLTQRLPSLRTGLSVWERRLVGRLMAGDETHVAVARALGSHRKSRDLIGDRVLLDRLYELARAGLLAEHGEGKQLRGPSFAPTALGRRVFRGRANRVELAGFDRWFGGTRLRTPDGSMWWFDWRTRRVTPG